MPGDHNLFTTVWMYVKIIRDMNAVFKRTIHTDAVLVSVTVYLSKSVEWNSLLA